MCGGCKTGISAGGRSTRLLWGSGVQAGPFNSLNRAEDLSDELNRQYPGNFVVAD
ncbi:MAG: hypothetical protein ACLR7Z_11880 [Bilophila wadsworthia]